MYLKFRSHLTSKTLPAALGVALAFLFCVFLLSETLSRNKPSTPVAEKGNIDLSQWRFETHGILPLEGEWEFFWKQLLSPDHFSSDAEPGAKKFLPMPSAWETHSNTYPDLTTHGYGTYRLTLTGLRTAAPLSLRINSLMGAYKIWVNTSLVHENGRVGPDNASQKAGRPETVLIPIPPDMTEHGADVVLVVQVSKYRYITGGTEFSLILGPIKQTADQWDRDQNTWLFSINLLLVMGCYHLVFFFFRRQEPSLLYFSLYCLVWTLILFINFSYQWPGTVLDRIPVSLLVIADQWAYFFAIPVLFLFIHAMFPHETPNSLPGFYLRSAVIMSALFPLNETMSHWVLLTAHILAGTSLVFFTVIIIKAVMAGRQASRLIFYGGIVLWLCGVNDILNALQIIRTGIWIPMGLLVFICTQSLCLALRVATAFNTAEELGRELKEKNIALSRLDSLKDEFIANTTHELLTPLSGIIGIAESMAAGAAGTLPQKAVRNLGMLAASGKRLAILVENILDFSRLKNNDLHIRPQPVNLRALSDITLRLLTPLASAKGLYLVNEIPSGFPPVMADENRLHQIFQNLVGNAIKFTPSGGVSVRARVKRSLVEVAVSDTGIGIPEDRAEDIFLYFGQVRSDASGAFEGTGLGLPITKRLIKLHKGEIFFKSRLNEGTTFYFTLPLADNALTIRPASLGEGAQERCLTTSDTLIPEFLKPQPEIKGGRPVILVVDDDPVNLQVAGNHLLTEGFNVKSAPDGEQALTMVSVDNPPDLVLLDIMMPGMNGYEVCEKLRETFSLSRLPIVMLTAKNRLQDLIKGFESGANDYVVKPFTREELIARVQTQIKINRAYMVLKENADLKKELKRRKRTELDLKMMQQQLAYILDTLKEAILAVNENREVCFSNTACSRLLRFDGHELLGRPVEDLFVHLNREPGKDPIEQIKAESGLVNMLCKDQSTRPCTIAVTAMDIEQERLAVLIIRDASVVSYKTGAAPAHDVIERINKNRRRIEMLERAMAIRESSIAETTIQQGVQQIQATLTKMEKSWAPITQDIEKNQMAVIVMNQALEYWKEATGLTKADLAEQSGLWKVYMNKNGFERTQTLDKYLDSEKFPKNPRWSQIYKTVDFVLLSCDLPSSKRKELEARFSGLKKMVK